MSDEEEVGTVPSSPVDETKPSDVPAETAPEAKGEDDEETHVEEEAPPKPRSGFQRQKLKIAALERQLEAERFRNRQEQRSEPLKRPKPEDFVDYGKFEDAKDAYDEDRMVRIIFEQDQQREQRRAMQRAQEARSEAVKSFVEECEDVAREFPDAQDAARVLFNDMGQWNPEILDVIQAAKNGPVIHYYLTKNPGLAKSLNRMDKVSAALTIGELQAKSELPQAKKATSAPPPINAPRGGASAPKDPFQLAKKDDASDYIRMRLAMEKEKGD